MLCVYLFSTICIGNNLQACKQDFSLLWGALFLLEASCSMLEMKFSDGESKCYSISLVIAIYFFEAHMLPT